jgi:hypothetical protein
MSKKSIHFLLNLSYILFIHLLHHFFSEGLHKFIHGKYRILQQTSVAPLQLY